MVRFLIFRTIAGTKTFTDNTSITANATISGTLSVDETLTVNADGTTNDTMMVLKYNDTRTFEYNAHASGVIVKSVINGKWMRWDDDSNANIFRIMNNSSNGNEVAVMGNTKFVVQNGGSTFGSDVDINGDLDVINTFISGDLFMRNLPPTDISSLGRTLYFDNIDENGYANIPDGTSLGDIKFRLNENSDYVVGNTPQFQEYSMIRGEVDANGSSLLGNLQGGVSFWTRSDGANGTTGLQKRMMIRHDGNVGIGTDNPTAKLDVNGDIRINSTPLLSFTWYGFMSSANATSGNIIFGSNLDNHPENGMLWMRAPCNLKLEVICVNIDDDGSDDSSPFLQYNNNILVDPNPNPNTNGSMVLKQKHNSYNLYENNTPANYSSTSLSNIKWEQNGGVSTSQNTYLTSSYLIPKDKLFGCSFSNIGSGSKDAEISFVFYYSQY